MMPAILPRPQSSTRRRAAIGRGEAGTTMDFSLSAEQEAIRDAVGKVCARFGDDYWLAKDRDGGFPDDFHRAFANDGWLGVCIPQEYGGASLGVTEAALMMQTIAESGAGMSGASALHMNIFGLNPVVVFGSDEQKKRMLPPLIAGKDKACFAVTEPNVGLDTLKLKTKAMLRGEHYVLSGQKIWISTAQVASKMLILARTTPLEQVTRRTDGLSLFYTDLDRRFVDVREIPKMGRSAVDSNELFIDALPVPVADRIGEEGKGFQYILHGMNPERILIGAEGIGLGRAALRKAASYAKERIVFDRPIGQNQAIQHPLAACWMALEAANLMAFKAASLYDGGLPCGVEANAAKYLAGEACFKACETALMTHGGMGYAKEFHVERYLRESLVVRIAPITPHLILSFIAEKALGLPKSY
jgi:acyl-CoA dehydrogenase